MNKVLVFGTFDGLHAGHVDFFRQAREQGGYLAVVVGRDSTVERTKGRKPKFDENIRLDAVTQCEYVDEARLGNEGNNPYKVIDEVRPRIICLGYDQTHFTDKLAGKIKEMGLKIDIIRLKPFEPKKYHSSLLNTPD